MSNDPGPRPCPPLADQFELLRQGLFCNSEFWPCGPYNEEAEAAGEDGGDGWVHYDTSNWVPPGK